MLIDFDQFSSTSVSLTIGLLAFGALCLIWAFRVHRFLPGLIGLVSWVLSILPMIMYEPHTIGVFVAKLENGQRVMQKKIAIGSVSYRFAEESEVTLSAARPAQIVINDSDRTLVVVPIFYGANVDATKEETAPVARIAPFSAQVVEPWIQFAGMTRPPENLNVKPDVVQEKHHWLTWE